LKRNKNDWSGVGKVGFVCMKELLKVPEHIFLDQDEPDKNVSQKI